MATQRRFFTRKMKYELRSGGGSSYDPDAQAYFNAIGANGGTISSATMGFVNTFVLAAKANGYWSKLVRVNPFCGNQLAAALTTLLAGGVSSADTNHNFLSGDYIESSGLTSDGTTKYLDTTFNPTTSVLSNTGAGLFIYSAGAGGQFGVGNISGGLDNGFWIGSQTDGSNLNGCITDPNSRPSTFTGGTAGMFGVCTVNTSSSINLYFNGSNITVTPGTADNAFTNNTIYISCVNLLGTGPFSLCAMITKFYAITIGMTTTDASNFYTDVHTLQTSLSRA